MKYFDLVRKLEKKNEMSKASFGHQSGLYEEAAKAIYELEKENEKLRERSAANLIELKDLDYYDEFVYGGHKCFVYSESKDYIECLVKDYPFAIQRFGNLCNSFQALDFLKRSFINVWIEQGASTEDFYISENPLKSIISFVMYHETKVDDNESKILCFPLVKFKKETYVKVKKDV